MMTTKNPWLGDGVFKVLIIASSHTPFKQFQPRKHARGLQSHCDAQPCTWPWTYIGLKCQILPCDSMVCVLHRVQPLQSSVVRLHDSLKDSNVKNKVPITLTFNGSHQMFFLWKANKDLKGRKASWDTMEKSGRVDTKVSLLLLLLRLTATVLTAKDCCIEVPDPNITFSFLWRLQGRHGRSGPRGCQRRAR